MLHHGALICSESGDIRYSCIDYNGDLVAVGNARGAIYFYRLVSKTTRLRPELALHVAPPANDKSLNVTLTCIRFSACQTYLAVGTASGIVLVFNLKDKCRLDIKSHHDDHRGKAISALCWSHDSSKLFSGCIGGVVIEFIFSESVSDWNSKSASTSSMALNFASALLLGKKNITLICQCEEIIRQIECTFSESCSTGAADILLVSVGHHSLLFQLPKKKALAPRFCDIPLLERSKYDESEKSQDVDENDIAARFDELWCASCFYNSYSQSESAHTEQSSSSYSPLGTADGIIIAQSTETGIELIYSSLDGELLQSFKLTGPYKKHGDEGSWDSCCLGVRCLTSFSSSSHKHLMSLITADNCVMLINLLDMSCDYLLNHFDYAVHAAVPKSGRLLILYEAIEQERMMADLIECFAPSTATLPLRIFDSHLHFSFSLLKKSWQRRKELERTREAESPALLLTPTSTSSYMSDSGNSFQYYEPDPDSDQPSNAIVGQENGNKSSRFCTKIFRSVSDLERARDVADLVIRKKFDDLEDDLNHALTDCDEHLEAWAFSASAPSSLSGYMGEPCVCCYNNRNSELGGGGGGARSLDEIVKYGAILNASQGVCLSEEAISQLSSLQHVLSAIDADEAHPKKGAIGVGYDYYGLGEDDIDQQKSRALATMVRSRAEERKKCLNMVLSESYSQEDLVLPLEASSHDFLISQCAAGDRNASARQIYTIGHDIASEGQSRNLSEKSNVQDIDSSLSRHVVRSGKGTDCGSEILDVKDISDVSEEALMEGRLAAIEDQIALLLRADKAMRNTSQVLGLFGPFHSVGQDKGSSKGNGDMTSCRESTKGKEIPGVSPESEVPILFDEDCDTMLLDPLELLERAEGAIQSTILVMTSTTCSSTLRSSSSSTSCSRMWIPLSDTQKSCTFCGKEFPVTSSATASNSPPGALTPSTKYRAASYSSSNGVGSVSNSTGSSNGASDSVSRADTEDWDDGIQVQDPLPTCFVQEVEVISDTAVISDTELKSDTEVILAEESLHEIDSGSGSGSAVKVEAVLETEEEVVSEPYPSASQSSAEIPPIPTSRTPSPSYSPPSSSSSPNSLSLSVPECTPTSPDEHPKRRKPSYSRKASHSDDSINRCESVCTDSVHSNCHTEDSGPSPFTDSDISWMEWWWDLDLSSSEEAVRPADEPGDDGQPGVALKARLLKARRTKRRIAGLGGGGDFSTENPLLPKSRILRVVRDMDTVPSLLSLRQEEAPRNMYDVIVIAPRGLGLNLALIPGGALVLRTFNPLADGHPGPVERTGVVKGGDYLLGINGLSLIGLGLEQIAEILQNIDRMGEVRSHNQSSLFIPSR